MEIGAEISKKIRVGNGLIIFIMLQFSFVHDEEEMHFMGMAGILLTLCNGRSKLLASPRYLNPTDSGFGHSLSYAIRRRSYHAPWHDVAVIFIPREDFST